MSSSSKRPASSGAPKKKQFKQGTLFSFFSKQNREAAAARAAAAASQAAADPPSEDDKDAPWQQVSVGKRIEVYWKDDDEYYVATVTHHRGKSKFTVKYDYDGKSERVDLADETFRLLPDAKKRRLHDDSDEEGFEMSLDASDDDEESAYEQDEAAAAQDEEDDDDQWMVTDEEEEEPKPKKKKAKFQVTQVKAPAQKSNFTTPSRLAGVGASQNTTVTPSTTASKKVTPSITPPSTQGAPLQYVQGALNPAGSHLHNHLKFLQNPKDSKGRSRSDPNYDPHTLKVDYRELQRDKKLTPASRQWWEIKSQYFDTVLFFKTGKFYELYHMDADVGVDVLEFSYMKGHVAHAGFPEISYGVMAERLVKAGYKVARVEQTETPEMLKERKKKKKRGETTPQVINREVCSILTQGTRTFCYLDDDKELSTTTASVGPLLAIREVLLETTESSEDEVQPVCEYGVTIVDAVRATVTIGHFADDVLRSRMNTLLSTFDPSEILIEGGKNGASPVLLSLLRSAQSLCNASLEKIQPTETFPKSTAVDATIRSRMERKSSTVHPWDVKETLDELHRCGYYPRASRQEQLSISRWPPVLQALVRGNAELALSSLGAALFYLQRNLIADDILGMGIVKGYVPPASSGTTKTSSIPEMTNIITQQEQEEDGIEVTAEAPTFEFESALSVQQEQNINHMALDGTTLQNLEILTNSQTHAVSGSLWEKLNYTKTPHGCRLLRAWLLRPLFRKEDISRRTDAVQELISGGAAVAMSEARDVLAKCGDIERLLSRVHSMGNSPSDENDGRHHPNNRAVLYEGATHTKRKVGDFSKVLNGLKYATTIPELFAGIEIGSGLIQKLVRLIDDGGCFPDMSNELDWFFDNFDLEQAALGLFEPGRGVDEAYDEACDAIERIKQELDEYKEEMCAELQPSHVAKSKWKYINTKVDSKDKYLIELPASVRVPDDFIVKGKRGNREKQVNKYRTPVVEQLVQELERAYDIQKEGKERGMELVFAKFDSMRHLWAAAAQATAMLDALGSLAQASTKAGYKRATILDCPPDGNPCVRVLQGKHPCVETTHSGGEFIPNDLSLGAQSPAGTATSRVLLLSGPNMGGKSTLLRQTCLLAILAQVGCYVPAQEFAFTPIDRIYTRLGASDRILQGQSTFFVELAETASALRGATRRSLVIMDELGRGTSTFDGTAIASACVKHLVERNQCLTLFATHYHSLLDEWKDEPSVRLGHMECLVEEGDSLDESNREQEPQNTTEHNITFLYTLGDGACPKSFGINVARLAGLPEEVLMNAKRISSSFEAELKGVDHTDPNASNEADLTTAEKVKRAMRSGDMEEVVKLWRSLQVLEE